MMPFSWIAMIFSAGQDTSTKVLFDGCSNLWYLTSVFSSVGTLGSFHRALPDSTKEAYLSEITGL
jgi:hypothetical protein